MNIFNKNKFNNNKGMAIVILLASISISLVLLASLLYVNDNQLLHISINGAREEALHIAEAGYNKFLWCLNDDSYFYKTGTNASQGLSPLSYYTSADNPLWNGIPKDYQDAEYRMGSKLIGYYRITVIPPTVQNPEITVKALGWSVSRPNDKRAIIVKIFKRKFTNFVDFSGDMKSSSGSNVAWGTGEQIKGPLFTNGTLRTVGVPVFFDETSYVVGTSFSSGTPQFNLANQPQQKTALVFPSSNTSLKFWGDPANGGYSYTGRTCILLNGVDGSGDTSASALKIKNKTNNDIVETRAIPQSGVIYVNGDVFISGVMDGRLTVLAEGNIYICGKDPTNFTVASANITRGITYANQSIPIARTDTFLVPCNDMLGLVSQKNVLINTKYWPDSSATGINTSAGYASVAVSNIKVQAAMFGLSNTSYYGVLDFTSLGDKGYIYLIGAKIASRMGATYTSSGGVQGYREDNTFDYRMLYDSPPYFIEPANAGWEVKGWEEVSAN